MKTIAKVLAAAALATAVMGSNQAQAGCGFACGAGVGLLGGVIAGAALANQPQVRPSYAPVYVAPKYVQPGYEYYDGPAYENCRRVKWYDEYGQRHYSYACRRY